MIDKIKIALIDDEPLFLEGLSLLFSNVKNIVVTNTATNGHELLDDLGDDKDELDDLLDDDEEIIDQVNGNK